VEGGAGVFTGFIRQRLFDKLSIYIAPIIIGAGIEAVGDLGVRKISQAVRLQHTVYQVVNQQIRVQGYRNLEDTFRTLTGNVPCLQELSRISAASAR
ncbi:MAG: dihydrofolate reductase family protein, partial [Calditrichaeota bacterium]|nr:dihydrofolate reductase family protein [Calditrichota bacterium]